MPATLAASLDAAPLWGFLALAAVVALVPIVRTIYTVTRPNRPADRSRRTRWATYKDELFSDRESDSDADSR